MLQTTSNQNQNGVQPGQETPLDFISIGKQATDIAIQNLNLLKSMSDAFSQMEAQASKIRQLFGGTELLGETFRNTLNDAIPTVTYLGGKLDDAAKMQLGVLKATNTQTLLNTDSYSKLFATMSLVSDGTLDAGKMTEDMTRKFIDAGYALENIGGEMEGIINTAREIGVSTSAVYSQISTNIGKLNTFGFENGVQGMAKMAADATLLRIDMGKTLNLADKLFDPEKAIQMANTFQRLGVSVTSLLDPYKLQDMARHDPAKLQAELGEALKAYTIFDEQTKRMKLTEFGMDMARNLSSELGMSTEEISKFATNVADLDRKMKEITFSDEFFGDKETQKMIAGLSQLGGKGTKFEGQYYVTLENEKGERTQKLSTQVNSSDINLLAEAVKPKTAIDLQLQANSILNNINNTLLSMKGVTGRRLIRDENIKGVLNTTMTKTLESAETANKIAYGTNRTRTSTGGLSINTPKMDEYVTKFGGSDFIKGLSTAITSLDIKKIEEQENKLKNLIEETLKTQKLTEIDYNSFFAGLYGKGKEAVNKGKEAINSSNLTQESLTAKAKTAISSVSSAAPASTAKALPAPITATQSFRSDTKVDVAGTIYIKVDPVQGEFDKSLARALDRADIQNKIMLVIKDKEIAYNNSIGNGNVPNMPSTAMS
jgi:hypothetical protein